MLQRSQLAGYAGRLMDLLESRQTSSALRRL